MPFDGQLLPLRRLTVADVLDGAFRTFRAVFAPAAVIVLVIIGPLQFATNLVLSRVAPGIVGGGLSAIIDLDVFAAAPADNALVLTNLVSGLLGYLLSLVASAGVVALLLAVDRGEEGQVTSPLGLAFKVLLPTLIASFLLGVLGIGAAIALAIGSLVLLVIPILGVVVMVLVVLPLYLLGIASFVALISLVVPVAVVERQGPLATLARAVRVFTRQPLRIAWISLLIGVVTVILALALQLPFLLLSEVAPTGGWAIEALGETAGQILSVPVSAAAALLVYLDVRVRWEAVDLRHRARTLVPR
ncbi:MAG: hypothetical protein EA387_16875 [Nitriliruptor sp.]|nr:MAG: hypothetical protein EA387_16875 [Nitriliruptor sp.]